MKMNGKYILIYSIQKEINEINVEVQLIMNDDILKPNQNIYSGVVYINGDIDNTYDLSSCVNAQLAAADIGGELKKKILLECKKERKRLKTIKEEIK